MPTMRKKKKNGNKKIGVGDHVEARTANLVPICSMKIARLKYIYIYFLFEFVSSYERLF